MRTPRSVRQISVILACWSLVSGGIPCSAAYSQVPVPADPSLIPQPESAPTADTRPAPVQQDTAPQSLHESFLNPSPLSFAGVTMTTSVRPLQPPPQVTIQGTNSLGKGAPLFGFATLVPGDRQHFSYRFDIGAAAGATVDVILSSGSDPVNLGGTFSLGLRRVNKVAGSEGLNKVHVIFVDNQGRQLTRDVSLSETEVTQNLSLSDASFDSAHVTKIILRQSYSDLDKSRVMLDRRGEIFVSLESSANRVSTPLPVAGQPIPGDYETMALTTAAMQTGGYNSGGGHVPGYIKAVPETEGYHFRYDVGGAPDSTVFASLNPNGNYFDTGDHLYLALKSSVASADAKVRLVDQAGNLAEYTLDLGTEFRLYDLDLQDRFFQAASFDRTKITSIEVLVDRGLSPERRGEVYMKCLQKKTDAFAASKPQITSSSANSAAQGLIGFSAIPGAVVYQIQVATDAAFTNIVSEGFPSETQEKIQFAQAGTYYIRVRASKSQQIETGPVSQWSEVRTLAVPADTFRQAKPVISGVAESGADLEIHFNTVTDAAVYEVQVASDAAFSHILHSGFPSQNSETFAAPDTDVVYVRVRASIQQDANAGPLTQWSDVSSYDRRTAFAQLKPDVYLVEGNKMNFHPLANAASYEYQISTASSFAAVLSQGTTQQSPVTVDVTNPGNYFFRVRAVRQGSGTQTYTSGWSNPAAFTISPSVPVITPQAAESDLVIMPKGSAGAAQAASVGPEGTVNTAALTSRGVEIVYDTKTFGWAGGGFRYDDFTTTGTKESADLRGLQNFVFGISGDSAELKLEVVDALGHSSSVKLAGIGATEKFWRIPAGSFTGIDFSKISYVYFIIEGNAKSGVLKVNALPAGLPLASDAALTVNDLPAYPAGTAGALRPVVVSPSTGSQNRVSIAERGVLFEYSTGTDGWAAGGVSYDNFETNVVETGNLSTLSRLVFGLKGTSSAVTVEIGDLQGRKVSFGIQGISATQEKYWKVPSGILDALDLNSVTTILFIVEGNNKQGSLLIDYLKQPQVILPDAAAAPADLPGLPDASFGKPAPASIGPTGTVNAASATQRGVLVQYGTSIPGWAGGGLSYDDFSTQAIEKADLSALDAFVFGIKGTASTMKFELVDSDGGRFDIPLQGISATQEKIFRIPKSLITGVNLTKLRIIYFIVEGANQTGSFEVNYLPPPFELTPSATVTPSAIVDFTAQTAIHGPTAVAPTGAVSNVTALARGVHIDFETRDKGWAGGGISFDNFSTTPVESADLSGLTQITFGLKGTVSKVKLEVIDAAGNKSFVPISGILPDQEKVWVLPLTLLPQVDLTKVRLMYFIAEGNNQTGQLEVYSKPAA